MRRNQRTTFIYVAMFVAIFGIILSFFSPLLGGPKKVEAVVLDNSVEEMVPTVSNDAATYQEVATDVADLVEMEVIPQPMSREEKIENAVNSYDVPLDYDVDLAFEGMDYLIEEQNFTIAGASGAMGNFYAECRFDSSLIDGYHKGLAQWDADCRWPMISEWLSANGYSQTSYDGQLKAIFYSSDANEFTSGNPYRTFDKMREVSDPADAAMTWLYEYERAPGQAEQLRKDVAQITYDLYLAAN